MYSSFEQLVSVQPDPEMERSNATHKHFIEALRQTFNVLGGDVWLSKQGDISLSKQDNGPVDRVTHVKVDDVEVDDADVDDAVIRNRFFLLSLGEEEDGNDDGEVSNEGEHIKATKEASSVSKQNKSRKKQKGK